MMVNGLELRHQFIQEVRVLQHMQGATLKAYVQQDSTSCLPGQEGVYRGYMLTRSNTYTGGYSVWLGDLRMTR